MSVFTRLNGKMVVPSLRPIGKCFRSVSSMESTGEASFEEEEDFERMPFLPKPKQTGRVKRAEMYRSAIMAPRYLKMSIDQDWNAVWPTAKSFNPNSVPLPVYMGCLANKPRLGKFNNPELVKIPNFLHLTPPNIKKQCQALKKFCSQWPIGLETEEKIEKHFPVEIITSDYCHASPTIRDPRARIVTVQFKLSRLELDEHSRDKMIRLLDKRYNPETDMVTIETSACPLRKQNIDYAFYQLTAVYYESWKTEDWEKLKEPQDWERFFFEKSSSKKKIMEILKESKSQKDDLEVKSKTDIENYGKALTDLLDGQENDETIDAYGRSVTKLLFS
ncbi:28S ribosomal protein S35, mitochondrial-like [Panonychus citri]|uniref:28S ribosomal protein S35, mitochondrial-like n=1 Tax=Panonychus citri TaxID=50023 RepID=UPI002307003F|nr:28S ribosomal protein S35, mitochondrial-like [Panonychus citri]